MTMFEALTLIIATLAAALSLWQAWIRFNDNKNKLHVKLSNGLLAYVSGTSGLQLFLQAVNKGKTPIYLSACGLSIDGLEEKIIIPRPNGERQLPCVLESHDSVQFWLDMQDLKDQLSSAMPGKKMVKIRGTFKTKAGLEAKSKPWKISL